MPIEAPVMTTVVMPRSYRISAQGFGVLPIMRAVFLVIAFA